MRKLLLIVLLLLPGAVLAADVETLKTLLNQTTTARARFAQVVLDKNRKTLQQASGTMEFSRPGRFRWVYDKPADQVIVGDGQRVWIYDRQLNQVTVRKLTAALGSTPAALLAGSSDIQSAFALSDAGEKDGLEWLDAKPRERDAGFERVRMGFGKDGLQAMELTDNFGQTTYLSFSKLERNPKVDPKEFRFDPPKGADVLGDR
jgi:outer membrane lipoprotein carrier protein